MPFVVFYLVSFEKREKLLLERTRPVMILLGVYVVDESVELRLAKREDAIAGLP